MPVVSSTDSRVTITGADIAAEIADDTPIIDPATLVAPLDRRADRSGAHRRGARSGRQRRPLVRDPRARLARRRGRLGRARGPVRHLDPRQRAARGQRRGPGSSPSPTRRSPTRRSSRGAAARARAHPSAPRRSLANPLAGRAVRQRQRAKLLARHAHGHLLAVVVFARLPRGRPAVAVMVLLVLGLAGAEAYAAFAGRGASGHGARHRGGPDAGRRRLQQGPARDRRGERAARHLRFHLVPERRTKKIDVLDGLGATIFVYVWIGVLGSYALLLRRPHSFVDGHGLAYLFGAICSTVANDSGALHHRAASSAGGRSTRCSRPTRPSRAPSAAPS